MKITVTMPAWITSAWPGHDTIARLIEEGKAEEALNWLTYTTIDMSNNEGWAEVGVAEITLTLHPRELRVAKELDALQKQLELVRAENHLRERALLDRINNLQALTFNGDPT